MASPRKVSPFGRQAKAWFLLLVLGVCAGMGAVFGPKWFWPQEESQQSPGIQDEGPGRAALPRPASPPAPGLPEPEPTPPEPPATPPEPPAAPPEVPAALPALAYTPPATVAALRAEEIEVAQRLVKEYPHDPKPLGLLGNVHNKQGNQSEAVRFWERSLELNPNDGSGYDALAMVALLREEHEKAAALWRKAAALDPTLPGVHYHLAQALAAMGESGEAIAVLKKDVQDSAKAGQGHWLLGQLYVQLKEYEKAKNSYQTAIQLQPDHAKAYYGLAVLSARLGQSDQARRYMDRFKQLKTRDVKLDKGRRSTYDDLEVMRAQVAGTYSDVGTVYAAHGNLPEAEQLWRKAAILDPGNTACRTNLATLYQRNRRQREAAEICEQLRALEPDNPVRYLNLGILRARLGQFDAAEQALRKACELAPRRSDGYRLLAQIRLDRNEGGAETMELARQAVRLEPIAPNYFVLGAACAKNGDLAGARSALQRAMALDPGNPKYRRTYELFQGN